jgi:hypothetical protein
MFSSHNVSPVLISLNPTAANITCLDKIDWVLLVSVHLVFLRFFPYFLNACSRHKNLHLNVLNKHGKSQTSYERISSNFKC